MSGYGSENTTSSPEDDPLFADPDNQIFTHRELLTIGHIPNRDRIVGRDDEITAVSNAIRPAVSGNSPNNLFIYGASGSGKSLVSRHVTARAEHAAESRGHALGTAYVDCSTETTETQAIRAALTELNHEPTTGISPPSEGIATTRYYQYLYDVLNQRYDAAILIFDEIETLDTDDLLLKLSRAQEAGKTDCRLGFIGISNDPDFQSVIRNRTRSSLQAEHQVFNTYTAPELEQIIECRTDAFADGVISTGSIRYCAAEAAQKHGDARQAINILRNAGELAERAGDETITTDHIKDARDLAHQNHYRELIRGLPLQPQLVFSALAQLSRNTEKYQDGWVPTKDVYGAYKLICADEDSTVLSLNRVRQLLQQQVDMNIAEKTKHGRGRARGVETRHRTTVDPDSIPDLFD